MFWKYGRVKISSQSNDKKTTDPHKESRAKTEEKGKDNENLQDMCKNHQGLPCNRNKKEFAKYIICGLQ